MRGSNSESDKILPPPKKKTITAGPTSYSVGAGGSFPLGKVARGVRLIISIWYRISDWLNLTYFASETLHDMDDENLAFRLYSG